MDDGVENWLHTKAMQSRAAEHGLNLVSNHTLAQNLANQCRLDRLFLQGMIKHHGGALTMVSDLLGAPGAAQESEVFAFVSDVEADQRMEIDRMGAMLAHMKE